MPDIKTRVALTRNLAGGLHEYLLGLSPADLSRPSACDEWQVQDVVSHLAGGAERQFNNMKRGLDGDSGAPSDVVAAPNDRMPGGNAQREVERRAQLGEDLLPTFARNYEELGGLMEGLSGSQWDALCWHARRGAMKASEYVDLRIQELALHDWDIRWGLDPAAKLNSESVSVLLDYSAIWRGLTFRPGPKLDRPMTFRFVITDSPSHSHDLVVVGDKFDPATPGQAAADATIECDGETYLLFAYGRLTAAQGVSSGRMTIDGGDDRMALFEGWFKGL